MLDSFIERIRAAHENATPLVIQGGGSKRFYGNPGEGEVLSTRGLAGVVDYQPKELVLTAHAGTPLTEIEALLAAHGQMLAFEPPHFSSSSQPAGEGANVALRAPKPMASPPLPNPDEATNQSTKPASGQVAGYLPHAGEGANVAL
ncbi:MAG: FAD-binding protein, partial [Gammaproteobacteria bacterium]